MTASKSNGCTPSSGNIFADIGLRNPEQDRYKADLIHTIADLIKRQGLSQMEAAKALNVDQPKISSILNGRISGFSTDRLLRFLSMLGYQVRISIDHNRTDHGAVLVEVR